MNEMGPVETVDLLIPSDKLGMVGMVIGKLAFIFQLIKSV